jgi:hypothetical protein
VSLPLPLVLLLLVVVNVVMVMLLVAVLVLLLLARARARARALALALRLGLGLGLGRGRRRGLNGVDRAPSTRRTRHRTRTSSPDADTSDHSQYRSTTRWVSAPHPRQPAHCEFGSKYPSIIIVNSR